MGYVFIIIVVLVVLFIYGHELNEKNEQRMDALIDQHIKTLAVKKKQLSTKDAYGIVDNSKWIEEAKYFMENILFEGTRKASPEDRALFVKIEEKISKYEFDHPYTFNDSMTPIEFEHYCADILNEYGWDARVTQASGDQGVDVIAHRNGITLAVQCKLYSSPVGNKAVQEVYSAKQHIGADYAVVVTNNTYTKSAIELSNTTGVILLHHSELNELAFDV